MFQQHKQIKDDVEMMEARKIRSMPSINGGGNLHKFLDSQASLDSGVWKNFFFLIECRKYVNEHSVKNVSNEAKNKICCVSANPTIATPTNIPALPLFWIF